MIDRVYVPDTNALLNNPELLAEKKVVILQTVLAEFTILERKKDSKLLQYKLREAKRALKKAVNKGTAKVVLNTNTYEVKYANDDQILEEYKGYLSLHPFHPETQHILVTDDMLMAIKAESLGIPCMETGTREESEDIVEGVYEFFYDPHNEDDVEKLANINEIANVDLEMAYNPFNLKRNQYVVVWDVSTQEITSDGNVAYKEAGTFKFNGTRLVRVKFRNISNIFERVRPVNVRQRLAFDLLQDEDVTVKLLSGTFGTGKDYIMLAHALDLVSNGKSKFDKIVWIRNNIEVKDTNGIGFLPDSMEDKLRPFTAPIMDKVGGEDGYAMIKDKIQVEHLGFLRGRQFDNAIVYVTECQANTRDHIKLLLGRVGKDSEIWFNGDVKQTDGRKFEYDNGINALMDLTGCPLFGHVTLDKVERSETANLASLLDL